MKRCPTVPVAPSIATLRLRMAVKSDASGRRCGEPAAGFVDPAKEAQLRGRKVGEDLVVREDPGALHAKLPLPPRAGIPLQSLVEQLSLAADVKDAHGQPETLPLDGGRIATAL